MKIYVNPFSSYVWLLVKFYLPQSGPKGHDYDDDDDGDEPWCKSASDTKSEQCYIPDVPRPI